MPEEFDAWEELKGLTLDLRRGGIVDCHSHPFTERTLIGEQYLELEDMELEGKWKEADRTRIRALSTFGTRINRSIKQRMAQGAFGARVYIDITQDIGLEALHIALEAKEFWQKRFYLQIAAYPVEGIRSKAMRELLDKACAFSGVEVIGCLPSRGRKDVEDIGTTLQNMEYYFEVAHRFDKAIDMQVDQKNHPDEMETRWLVGFAEEYRRRGYTKPIAATHCLSMAAWEDEELIDDTLDLMVRWNVSMIVCPRATLNNKQGRNVFARTHNSIAPWDRALAHGVNVAIGTDNVSDLYMPLSDGDIWKEVDTLINAVRFQGDLLKIVDILTVNGRKALGL